MCSKISFLMQVAAIVKVLAQTIYFYNNLKGKGGLFVLLVHNCTDTAVNIAQFLEICLQKWLKSLILFLVIHDFFFTWWPVFDVTFSSTIPSALLDKTCENTLFSHSHSKVSIILPYYILFISCLISRRIMMMYLHVKFNTYPYQIVHIA